MGLEDTRGNDAGKLKVAFIVEIVRDPNTAASASPSSSAAGSTTLTRPAGMMGSSTMPLSAQRTALLSIVAEAQRQQTPGSLAKAEEVEDVVFPLLAQLHRVSVRSLDSVHRFSKNSPYVSVAVDDWAASTPVNDTSLSNFGSCF